MQITANSVKLLTGGNVIKQGDQTPLTFELFDEQGNLVELQGTTVNVKIANNDIVLLEKTATVNSNNTITFSLSKDDVIGNGNMRIEFTVTYADLVVEKFPADGWQEIRITPSLDNLNTGKIAVVTFEQVRQEYQQQINDFKGNVDETLVNVDQKAVYAQEQGDYAKAEADRASEASNKFSALSSIAPKESFRTVHLVTGQEDESPIVTNSTLSVDTVNYKVGSRAWKATTSAAVTATLRISNDLLKHPPASAIGAWVYIEDPALLTQLTVEIRMPSGATWSRTATNLKQGWNLLRFPSSAGAVESVLVSEWGIGATWVRLIAVTTGATSFTVGHVWAECPPKAQILFIEDGGYKTFLDTGYQDLKQRSIPVTWSLDPAKLGTNPGTKAERITEADVLRVGKENQNSMNFHGYTGDPTSAMTEAEIRADVMKSLKWLEQRGFTEGHSWRSAWVQNSAQNAQASQDLLMAYATPSSSAALANFPPTDRWNIPRIALHGMSQSALDSYFNIMKATNQLMVIYTHGIHTDGTVGGNDTTPAEWSYFISKIEQGIAEGWLEGVTLEMLMKRAQVEIKPNSGDWVTNIYQPRAAAEISNLTDNELTLGNFKFVFNSQTNSLDIVVV